MAEVERKQSPKTPENTSRGDTVPFGFEPVPSLDEDSQCPSAKHGKHKEMWLIKVPAEFDASCLSGKTVVLNGSQDVPLKQGPKSTKTRFEVISKPTSNSVPGSCKVLLPSSHDEPLWAGKEFFGNMSVIQSGSVPTPDSPPSPGHSSQHVQVPEITCRWKPFGHKKPFSSTQATTAKKEKENKSVGDYQQPFGFIQKNRPSESYHKQEAERSAEANKHKNKIKIKQEKVDDQEDLFVKNKKIKTEKSSPQQEVQIKTEKVSPAKEKSRKEEENEKEKGSLSFIPLDVTVMTEAPFKEEGETPRKKRKKEKKRK